MNLVRALGDEEQAADDENQVPPGDLLTCHGDELRRDAAALPRWLSKGLSAPDYTPQDEASMKERQPHIASFTMQAMW